MTLRTLGTNVAALNNAYGRQTLFNGSGGTADQSAALQAAINAMKVGGHLTGELVIKGNVRLSTGIVLDGGYADLANIGGTNWTGGAGEQFKFIVEGALVPDAGIGNAVTAKGLRDATFDIYIKGGGQAGDNGLHIENLIGADITVKANGYAGTVLHADANGDATKTVTQSFIRRLYATVCGQALYFRAINAFGQFGEVWDNGSTNGAVFDTCADTTIQHWESFTTATQTYGLDFVSCNTFWVDAITLGDRPSAGLMRIKNGDFGVINKLRVSGRSAITPTIEGVRLEEVSSVEIDTLYSFRTAQGLHVVGGGGNGIRVKRHVSLTGDVTPLAIDSGTGTAPRINVHADYRNHSGASVAIGSGLTGGSLKLAGYTENMWNGGASGKYAVTVDATSASFTLKIADFTQATRSGISGFTDHATPANVDVSASARLGDTLKHGAAPASAGVVAGSVWTNTSNRCAVLQIVWRFDASTTSDSGVVTRVGPDTGSLVNVGNLNMALNAGLDEAVRDLPITLIVPAHWGASVTATGAGGSIRTSFVYYI